MNCDKCHGWIEDKYHPQVLKRNKEIEMKEGTIIEKKMISSQKQTKDTNEKVSRISMLVDEKYSEISKNNQQSSGIRDLGAPFFKKEANS
jgi:predicted DNA-binding antitoxin AbrB/MazE fold protein